MKKNLTLRKSMLTIALASFAVVAMAQEDGNRDAQNRIVRGPYETNRFFDNWFIGVGGGVNVYMGEHDSYGDFGKRLAPAIDVSLGKWITPSVGIRLQYSGLQAKGWNTYATHYTDGMDGNMFKEKFNVMNLHGDFMWNLSNAIGGYKETRTWSFVPYVGVGWARSASDPGVRNDIALNAGLLNVIRLGNVVDLTLEARYMMVNEGFDYVAAGSKGEAMVSLTAGLQFNLGRKNFSRVKPPVVPDYTPYQNRIKALEDNNSALAGQNRTLANEVEALRDRPVAVTVESTTKATPVALFFSIGKATLDNKELANLDFYVTHAMKVDTGKVFTIIGSADSATGSAETNRRLSEQRMQYVYDILVSKYNIPASRLVKKAEGDANNRFAAPELNRCVIIE